MTSRVRAKFRVRSINHLETSSPDDTLAEVSLYAVYGDGKGNESWSRYTPSGDLKMMITNPAAIDAFDVGKDYYLDITPVT